MALTITEALAEIKTIQKRIAKKREFVGGYLARQDFVKDPLENQGGSKSAIAAERQGINDLEQRVVAIRSAIQRVNATTAITVNGETRTIADWLVWRREVAPGQRDFLSRMRQTIQSVRQQVSQKGFGVRQEGEPGKPEDLIVNVDEKALATEAERLEDVLGTLDGQLSLKNATVVIDA